MKISLGDCAGVYGCFGRGVDYAVKRMLRMADPVDGELLEKAVRDTQKRYPYFSVRLRKNDKEYYYEENDSPIVLFHTDKRIRLNTAESNYHSWAVSYTDDCISLEAYHGLMDGTGMHKLLATLAYYYCYYRYGLEDHTGIRTLEDPVKPEETLDPLESLSDFDPSKMPKIQPRPAYSLIEDGGLKDYHPTVIDMELSEKDFVKFTSANDASPGTMTALLLEKAIDAWAGDRDKPITCNYVINARPMLNSPESHHNCITAASFVYDDRMKKLPFGTQTTCHRGITFLASDEIRVVPIMEYIAFATRELLEKSPTLEDKKAGFSGVMNANKPFQTAMVSYVGRWKYPSIESYVREFWTHAPAANDLCITISAISGKLFFSFQQLFENDAIFNGFLAQLDEHGIRYEIKRKINLDTAAYPEPE